MANKEKKVKRYYRRTIDLVFLLILLIVCIYAFYKALTFNMLPKKWVYMAMAPVAVIYLILFVLALKKMPTWAVVIKRFIIILLCIGIGTGGYFINRVKTTTNKIATVNSDIKTEIYVMVRNNSDILSLEDLSGKTIGYQDGTDKKNAVYVQQQIENEVSNTYPSEVLDYTSLYQYLMNGDVDAVAISEQYFNMTKANEKTFNDDVKVIHTYKKDAEKVKSEKDITKDVFTVYISGIDNAGSPDQVARTDVNLILIVNPKANHIDMVSLPRDGFIPNMALQGYNDKLTHTAINGVDNSIASLENFIGLPIDYYARMSFTSVAQIVDAVGGIDIDVELDVCAYDESEFRTQEEYESHEGQEVVCVKKGNQHLNGAQALVYARHRKSEGYDNPGRERAQQRVIKGVISKLISPNALGYIDTLLEIAPNFVITNMPNDQISNFIASELNDLKPWTINSLSSDTGADDKRYVASLSQEYGPLDVYLFSKEEIHAILDAYDGAKNQLKMNTFNFDLNDLYANTPELKDDANFVWDTMAGTSTDY